MAVTAEIAATVKVTGIGVQVIAFGKVNKGYVAEVVFNAEAKIGGVRGCEVLLGHLRRVRHAGLRPTR